MFNGHRSWNAWNISLWIGNDEKLYRLALKCLQQRKTRMAAARLFLTVCPTRTPDGGKFNLTCVYEAMEEM